MKNFAIIDNSDSQFLTWFKTGLKDIFMKQGYQFNDEPVDDVRLVFNFADPKRPRPFRRKAQATFVISILESDSNGEDILKEAYPYLVRTLSNHLVFICHGLDQSNIFFITPEQGRYKITYTPGQEDDFFQKVFHRLEPLASSQLVIDNHFISDLPKDLWEGDEITRRLSASGKKLEEMNLLPAPFPIEQFLNERDMRQLKKLYGIGGLSYGNLSARKDEHRFWMSASGVNKAKLETVGEDILLINNYDQALNAMEISVPPHITPKRASVDAIEHWMVYSEHPEVGAIVHIHAWLDGIKETEINYPCGTIQLAGTVANLIRQEENPAQCVIGLKNHGLTITGTDLDDIFDRIEGRIIQHVPMS